MRVSAALRAALAFAAFGVALLLLAATSEPLSAVWSGLFVVGVSGAAVLHVVAGSAGSRVGRGIDHAALVADAVLVTLLVAGFSTSASWPAFSLVPLFVLASAVVRSGPALAGTISMVLLAVVGSLRLSAGSETLAALGLRAGVIIASVLLARAFSARLHAAQRGVTELLLEHADDAVVVVDRYGHITGINQRAAGLFGGDGGGEVGRSLRQLTGGDELGRLLRSAMHTGTTASGRVVHEGGPDPAERELVVKVRPLPSTALWPIGALVIAAPAEGPHTTSGAGALAELSSQAVAAARQAVDLNAAIYAVVREICQSLGYAVGHAYVVRDGRLHSSPAWYMADEGRYGTLRSLSDDLTFSVEFGPMGEAIRSGRAVQVGDITDVVGLLRHDAFVATGLRGAIFVPLKSGSGGAAVLELYVDRALPDRDPNQLAVLEQIGYALGHAAERIAIDAAVRESAERFFQLFQHIPTAIALTSRADGRFRHVNEAFLRLFGTRREAVIGRTAQELLYMDPADRQPILDQVQRTGRAEEVEVRLRTARGEVLSTLVWVEPMVVDGEECLLTTIVDVTDRVDAERQLRRQALHDPLTDLPNRLLFRDRLERTMMTEGRCSILYLDVDRFKEINDGLGHSAGDSFLGTLGNRIAGAVQPTDTVARFGGDEFAVLLPHAGSGAEAQRIADRISRETARPILLPGAEVVAEVSIGIVVYPDHGATADALLQHADVAMYRAKRDRSIVAIYEPESDPQSERRITLVSELRQAIAREELVLHFQPIIALATGRWVAAEALVRWEHPHRGRIPPAEFIPLAEESGLIRQIGHWTLREGLRRCAAWQSWAPGVSVAVNLSPRSLQGTEVVQAARDILQLWQLPPGSLTVEVTESTMMADPQRTLAILEQLHGEGVRVSVDDFGTGYSSLSYLQRLPVRELKIDRVFVKGLTSDAASEKIVRSTIQLAHQLGLLVVAEGVEDATTLDTLRALECDLAQGYFIARPQPIEDLREFAHRSGAETGGGR